MNDIESLCRTARCSALMAFRTPVAYHMSPHTWECLRAQSLQYIHSPFCGTLFDSRLGEYHGLPVYPMIADGVACITK